MALYKRFERTQVTTWACDVKDCPWEFDSPTILGSNTAPPEVQRAYDRHDCKDKPGDVNW